MGLQMEQLNYMMRRLTDASYGRDRISWLEERKREMSRTRPFPNNKSPQDRLRCLAKLHWDQQAKLHYWLQNTCMCYPALLEGWGFTVNLPVSTGSRQFAKSHYHWIITDRYRLVHVILGSWSTVLVPQPPPIWQHNFLGTYTTMQTQKLIWLKNNFFHWATSSLTSVHWSVTALDKQLCRSQEVARRNGLRWLLPRRCVQDHSLKLGFTKNNINKKRETYKKI